MPNITGRLNRQTLLLADNIRLRQGTVTFKPYLTDARVNGQDGYLGVVELAIRDLPDPLPIDAGDWTITVSTIQVRDRRGPGRKQERAFKNKTVDLTISGDISWGEILEETVQVPPVTPSLVQQAQTAAIAAGLSATTADAEADRSEAAANLAEAISGLTGEDDAVTLLANTPTTDLYAAIMAGFAQGHVVTHPRFGAVGDGITDDTAAIQACIDLGGVVLLPPGEFMAAGLNLPDFTTWEDPNSINRPLRIIGAGEELTRLVLNDDTAPYLIGHPSVGGTENRGQNSYQSVTGMTLIGAGDHTKNIPVLALSNVYKGRFADLHIEGCPGGPAIWNYSHSRGGGQGNVFERISTYKGDWTISPAGWQLFDMDVIRQRGVRYLIHNDGPRQSVGKANDTLVHDCHVYVYLIGGIDTRGHGSLVPDGGGQPGGGCDNLRIVDSFFQSEATRRIEDGLLEAATSTTFTLRTEAGEFVNDSTDVYQDCVLRLKDPATGKWHSRWIDGYTAGTRVVTVPSAFAVSGFTPGVGTEYRISYSDASARADGWAADVGSHGLLWEPSEYQARIVDCRFEKTRAVVATPEANHDVVMEFNYELANDGLYGIRTNGTPWRPRVWVANKPRGSTTAPVEIQAPTIVLSNPVTELAGRAVLTHLTNDTGGTVVNGNVVSIKSGNNELAGASSGGSNNQQHAVVFNPGVSSWAPGEQLTVAIVGIVPVKINAACSPGDLLVPANGLVAGVIAAASVTAADLHRALGKALHSAGGGSTVLCKLRN